MEWRVPASGRRRARSVRSGRGGGRARCLIDWRDRGQGANESERRAAAVARIAPDDIRSGQTKLETIRMVSDGRGVAIAAVRPGARANRAADAAAGSGDMRGDHNEREQAVQDDCISHRDRNKPADGPLHVGHVTTTNASPVEAFRYRMAYNLGDRTTDEIARWTSGCAGPAVA
jgi:hypothetical protein